MTSTRIRELQSIVAKLQAERQSHVDAVDDIDVAFEKLGITPGEPARRRGRPPGKRGPAPDRRGRPPWRKGKRYAVSGTSSILALLQSSGGRGITGSDIDKHWKAEGRAGNAYNALGQLLSAKKIKRQRVKGQRGSRYTMV